MAIATAANSTELLKILYPNGPADQVTRQHSKFYDKLVRDTSFGGKWREITVTIAGGAGISADYATAYANSSATKERSFQVTREPLYGIVRMAGDAIAGTLHEKQALARLLDHNIKHANLKFNRAIRNQIWSVGGGALTQLTSATTVSNAYFQCDPVSDAAKFEVGDLISAASGVATGERNSGATMTVTAINKATGVVTVDQAMSTSIAAIANTDYLFRSGTFGHGWSGVRAWIPTSDPSSATFFGVDRTEDITALSGLRYDGSGELHTDAIASYCALEASIGSMSDIIYISPFDFRAVEAQMQSKAWVDVGGTTVSIGHRGLRYESPSGTKTIVSEPFCPTGYGFALTSSTWHLRSAGECPSFLDFDKIGKILRAEATDSVVCRMGAYGNITCDNPGENGCIKFKAVA